MSKTKVQNKFLGSAKHKCFCFPIQKTNFSFFLIILLLFLFLLPVLSFATEAGDHIEPKKALVDYEEELIKETPVLPKGDLIKIIFTIIQYLLSFLGVIAVLVILYSGFLWMTAAGNEEKVSKAKKMLTQAVTALIIILLAYAITMFVITKIHGFE